MRRRRRQGRRKNGYSGQPGDAELDGGHAPTGAVAKKPATGKTVEVKMIGDGTTYKFEPASITIKAGDNIKWIMVSGGPHNVSFDPAEVPAAAKAAVDREHGQPDERAVRSATSKRQRIL